MAEDVGSDDLSPQALEAALPGRPFRTYPAVLSTEADAMAWARAGGPHGAVVVAGYQASPRGRAGIPWSVPGTGALGFSMLLCPTLSPEREGWLYVVGLAALADVCGALCTIAWPDTVRRGDRVLAELAVQTDVAPGGVGWAVMSLLMRDAPSPRGPLLARLVDAVMSRAEQSADVVLAAVRARCETIGRTVRARVLPLGPRGIVVEGTATDLNDEGSLVVQTAPDRCQPVRPQDLGVLDGR